jgi:hypothetical protein
VTEGNLVRRLLPFERNFVQLPNGWMRDERLSWAARGLLANLMTHEPSFTVSITSLAKASPQGPDILRTAVAQLEQYGYLVRRKSRIGRPDNWEICDPSGLYEPALIGYQEARQPVDNIPLGKSDPSENPTRNPSENPTTIRTLVKNNQVPAQPQERRPQPVDNSDASGGSHQPADAMAETCSHGHPIIGRSGGGVPFCSIGCPPVEVPA